MGMPTKTTQAEDVHVKDVHRTKPLPPGLRSIQLGIWRVILRQGSDYGSFVSKLSVKSVFDEYKAKFAEAKVDRLFRDVYSLGPGLVLVSLLTNCLEGLEDAMSLWSLNRLLNLIETAYREQRSDSYQILKALLIRILFVSLISTWRWIAERTTPILTTRVKMHFEERILRAHLSVDLPSSLKNSGDITVSSECAWDAFQAFLNTMQVCFTVISQVSLVVSFSLTKKDSVVVLFLCLIWPLYTSMSGRSLWSYAYISYAISEPYLRLRAMYRLASENQYKKEVISGGLAGYIMQEFRKARELMGDTSDAYPWRLYSQHTTPFLDIATALLKDFPLIYYAVECIRTETSMSIAALAMLQQTASTLESTVYQIVQEKGNIVENLRIVRELYADYGNVLDEAEGERVPYAPTSDHGMGVELRNVSFQYPTAEAGKHALTNVSFTLAPSSLVVIVGANGSGKSSIVNLLTGLYTPTTGTLFVDGHPAKSYRKEDLQAAIALLTQEQNIFSFSIGETIGIGDPDSVNDEARIEEAARLGGAYEFVKKFEKGFQEMLQPVATTHASDYPMKDEQLRELLDEVEIQKELSGGERQRLAASRTFMRLMSRKVRLVVVDEPTSAMDPLGEYELFERLRAARAGKTMVFVTHRFGHLTRHADTILCMKDGELVEAGTHHELIAKAGEYCKLYEIQASAFTESRTEPSA